MTSRREVIKAIGAGAAALPVAEATEVLAQGAATPPASDGVAIGDFSQGMSASDPFLAQFEQPWSPLDPQLRAVLRLIYAGLKGLPPPAQLSPTRLRQVNAGLSFYFNAGAPPVPHVEERTIAAPSGRIKVRLYDPGTPSPAPTVILLHGGGWVFGSIDTYDGFARQIAQRSGLRCLSVDYALAPEHPFPAPLNDCIAAIRWAVSEGSSLGIDPQRIALIGDSSGANLVLAACLALRDAGASPVRGAALRHEFRLWKGVVHAAVSLMGWIDTMGPEVDRVGEFLQRVTAAGR